MKKRHFWEGRPRRRRRPHSPPLGDFLLDRFSELDVSRWKDTHDKIIKFHWDFFSDLARQRSRISGELKASLAGNTRKHEFSHWQRVVTYKHSLTPLSAQGSLSDPGRRFNIGDISPTAFPCFPALYIGQDKETVLQEVLSQKKLDLKGSLSAFDMALMNPESISAVSISGKLESAVDLGNPASLRDFVRLIKEFKLPESLQKTAIALGLGPLKLIETERELQDALLHENWRAWPMHVDVPATC